MKLSVAVLALSAVTEASPFVIKRADPWENKDTLCKWSTRTPEDVQKLWDATAAGMQLELFIKSQWEHQNSWLKNLENAVSGGTMGQSGASGCGVVDGQCEPMNGMLCGDQFDKFGASVLGSSSYWIFRAAVGAHNKIKALHEKLKEATLGTGLSAGFGLLSGLFSGLAAETDDGEINAGGIQQTLARAYEAGSEKLLSTLRIAMGGGTSEDEYNSLPAPMWDTYETKIAKFFNGGWFLLDDDTAAVDATLKSLSNNIKTKITNEIMKSVSLHLVADKSWEVDTQEKCGFAPGRQWMELKDGKSYCFYIMRRVENALTGKSWEEAGADIYEHMATYGLGDRDAYYRNVINCALGGGGDIDTSNMVWNEVPRCYFNLGAVFVERAIRDTCGPRETTCGYFKDTPLA
ncbi:hypothetical protein FZEAL_2533 [Fusarium zealandicum]|uniref:Uncharacterized protein n=1 Tax=Fusarium zealandicum TaxID=1053134 RepID=A0A8H4UQV6_9HYPO|nr:hypothetical protein FZEAL_2533 [Fusarium zealandicum]